MFLVKDGREILDRRRTNGKANGRFGWKMAFLYLDYSRDVAWAQNGTNQCGFKNSEFTVYIICFVQ